MQLRASAIFPRCRGSAALPRDHNPTHQEETMFGSTGKSAVVLALAAFVAAAASAQDTRTLRFTAASNKGHPQVQGVEKFAELVAQKSGGKIKIQAFPGGTLGPDLQVVSAMQGGTIDLNVMNASLLAGNVKEMAILDLP